MGMAETVARRSKDPRTKVGAVIVSEDKTDISSAYNGFPTGMTETDSRWEDKYQYVIHAELNAILNAKKDLRGWTLYCTMFPCRECTKVILQTGIKRVVYLQAHSASVIGTIDGSKGLFAERGVKVEQFSN